LHTKELNSNTDNIFNRENYFKSILEYRRFRIMHDLAYNMVNIPIFNPITDSDDLIIIDYLAEGKSHIFNPYLSRLKEAQYAKIFELAQRPPGPPSNTSSGRNGRFDAPPTPMRQQEPNTGKIPIFHDFRKHKSDYI
jgi:hypothetical protein